MWSFTSFRNAVPGDPWQVWKAVLIGLVVYLLVDRLPLDLPAELREQAQIAIAMTAGYLIDQAYLWLTRFLTLRKQNKNSNAKS